MNMLEKWTMEAIHLEGQGEKRAVLWVSARTMLWLKAFPGFWHAAKALASSLQKTSLQKASSSNADKRIKGAREK
ncbi:MAG: hypothetical protein H0W02_03470 [Ktedonobacteraceae bacterium]|nr:hypothetical protein [Ktedonobacteraceae bacterium]